MCSQSANRDYTSLSGPNFHKAPMHKSAVSNSHTIFPLSGLSCLEESHSVSFKDNRGITCRRTLRQWNGNFSSGYFNSVYSCLHFLFPVLLNTLPALPFLLFLHHYCPLFAKKRHWALGRQYPVC